SSEAAPSAGPAAGPPPSPPAAPDPPETVAGPDPFARLARALLVDALDEGAQAVEIGPEGRGTILRTFSGGLALSSRPLPQAVLAPLLAWILARSRPSGPFEEGGFVLERSGRRVRVEVTTDASGTAWLVLEPMATRRGGAGETEICLHEGAEGDVFCPACGAPV
ncbi:MAG: hypothetical protein KJ062_20925, partial [Thermoanaerobaculia bacterium]|nr:hypothetical protein [Thermoanaerobaculia bacterium]